jgi:hypothetical protein
MTSTIFIGDQHRHVRQVTSLLCLCFRRVSKTFRQEDVATVRLVCQGIPENRISAATNHGPEPRQPEAGGLRFVVQESASAVGKRQSRRRWADPELKPRSLDNLDRIPTKQDIQQPGGYKIPELPLAPLVIMAVSPHEKPGDWRALKFRRQKPPSMNDPTQHCAEEIRDDGGKYRHRRHPFSLKRRRPGSRKCLHCKTTNLHSLKFIFGLNLPYRSAVLILILQHFLFEAESAGTCPLTPALSPRERGRTLLRGGCKVACKRPRARSDAGTRETSKKLVSGCATARWVGNRKQ